jgi:hypothetical protein
MSNRTLFAVALLSAVAAAHPSQAQCQLYPNGQCVGTCSNGECIMVGGNCACPRRQPVEVKSSDRLANFIRPNGNRQNTCRKQEATRIQFECE